MKTKTKKLDFTEGSIFGKLILFMLPVLGAQILQAMYGAVDLLVVGKFGTNAGISGVSTGSGIMNLVTFVITGLATGVTVLISRYIGAKRQDRIKTLIGNAVAIFLVISAVLMVVLILFAKPIAILMQAPPEAADLTANYIRVCGCGCVFVVFYNLLGCIFRGMGDSNSPLLFVGIACVVNIFGDLLFVAVLGMNVVGAALATVLAQAVSVILSLGLITKRKMLGDFSLKDVRFGKEGISFLKIGYPLALQEFLTNLSFLALCAFVNDLGLAQSNGYGIGLKITSFVMLIPSSLMQSLASYVAQNVGAKKEDRAKKGMYYGMLLGFCVGIVVFCVVFFKGDLLASIFTNSQADIDQAQAYLKGFAPEALVTCILFSFIGYFNGHSKSTFVMIQGLAQAFLVRVPMSYILSIQPNASLTNIGYAAPSATAFGIILCLIYFVRMKKKDTSLLEEQSGIVTQSYNSDISTVITIGRSYGAGGRTVGKLISEKLNIPFFDKNIMVMAAKQSGMPMKYLSSADEKNEVFWDQIYGLDKLETLHSMAQKAQTETITAIANNGGCIIVGRRADQILRGRDNLIRVFITASLENRVKRIVERDGLSAEKAKARIRKVDKERADYYNSLSGYGWGEAGSYDLCVDTDLVGLDGTVEMILKMVSIANGKSSS